MKHTKYGPSMSCGYRISMLDKFIRGDTIAGVPGVVDYSVCDKVVFMDGRYMTREEVLKHFRTMTS